MSGIQGRIIYDECATIQTINQSTKLFKNYDFELYQYENTLKTNTMATCDGKFAHVECNLCNVNQGTLTNTLENIDYRINLENDLIGITRLNTGCDINKYKPCYINNKIDDKIDNKINNNECDKYRSIYQPLLCDRSIVPTNMKPFVSGFSYK